MNIARRLELIARDVLDQYDDREVEQKLRGIREWLELNGYDGDLPGGKLAKGPEAAVVRAAKKVLNLWGDGTTESGFSPEARTILSGLDRAVQRAKSRLE